MVTKTTKRDSVPIAALERVLEMAEEMSGATCYGKGDEVTGEYLGPRDAVVEDLALVRAWLATVKR